MTMVREKRLFAQGLFKTFGINFFADEIILLDDFAFAYSNSDKCLFYYIPYQGWNKKHFSFAHQGSCTEKFTDNVSPSFLAKSISFKINKFVDYYDTRMTNVSTKNFRFFIAKNEFGLYGCTVSYSYKLKDYIIENVFEL